MRRSATSTVLVTGATGFVGASLCRHFAAKGHRVVAVCGPSGAGWRLANAASTIETVKVDLTAANEVSALLRDAQPEVVLNCAAYGAYPSQTEPSRIYRVNFEAVRHLVEAAGALPGFRAFVHAGSSSEYGLHCTAPREDSAPLPDSDYAVSKVAATAFVQFVSKTRNFPGWVLRLSSVYGPYEEASRLIPRLLKCGKEGTYPPLVDPQISRDFVYIDDVCNAFERVVESATTVARGEVFNIGSGHATTLATIVERVRQLFGIAQEPVWGSMANRRWDHRDWYSNPTKAFEMLGWKATTSLDDGLAATARFTDENTNVTNDAERHAVTGAR
ncbi:UDP-glucose 4-epimerase [Labilithrix luteola]|uniref:UDP-glucose 4-epimerase n=1 Tax=Labilithrix luteola TaxID=1391654 RepID=A0A0K1PMT7_9BACT|nr:NAD(P)-dependent oxidoreductase [Labilithrix luteola]AKU94827.1 UDP-glucose 4-epimerase [Labilithrix luteola]